MNLGLEGRVAIVSGGSRGIGRAIAEALVHEGAMVVIAARTQSYLDEAAADMNAGYPGKVAAVRADMSDQAAVQRVVDVAHDRFGPVGIAVSNVIGHVIDADKEGDGAGAGNFSTMSHKHYRDEFTRLLVSAWALAHATIPDMRAQHWGRIMNVGSGAAREPTKILPHVMPNTVRPPVAGMYRVMARRLAPDGITVNNLLTGSILTERNKSYWQWLANDRQQTVEEASAPMNNLTPAGRAGDPHEMAAVALFLASDRAAKITGQSIPIDGGINQ